MADKRISDVTPSTPEDNWVIPVADPDESGSAQDKTVTVGGVRQGVTGDFIGVGINSAQKLSQAEFDALSPSSLRAYFIVG